MSYGATLGALALLPALLLPPAATAAQSPVSQTGLSPTTATADTPVAATLKVTSKSCVTVDELGVGVRGPQGGIVDFPGSAGRTRICSTGHTLTTGRRSFPAGAYTEFGFYRIGSTYHNLTSQTLTVTPAGLRQLSLTADQARAGTPVSADLQVTAATCQTVDAIGVAVRDAAGNHFDFPGSSGRTQVCPGDFALSTEQRTFDAGDYTMFGYYRVGSTYYNLPTVPLTVRPANGGGQEPPPSSRGRLVLNDNFDQSPAVTGLWSDDRSSAYRYGNHNPDDDKLDWIVPQAVVTRGGTVSFVAKPGTHRLENGKTAWDTGLITTEYARDGFQLRTGDWAELRFRVPRGLGAWPALWTWKDGDNEIDTFEYHPDNPHLLELSNRIRFASKYYDDPKVVQPGGWVTIAVHYGADNCDWYVNDKLVFSDHMGVGARWSAYLILNLSITAGKWHPSPDSHTPIQFDTDYLRVWSPAAG
ncbi:hypothetical protein GXW82_01645 [Streptacidiphilus sp. 4-A2]|nr:hypothetical protein [Streptacidiphilus sp. 4-A2]